MYILSYDGTLLLVQKPPYYESENESYTAPGVSNVILVTNAAAISSLGQVIKIFKSPSLLRS